MTYKIFKKTFSLILILNPTLVLNKFETTINLINKIGVLKIMVKHYLLPTDTHSTFANIAIL